MSGTKRHVVGWFIILFMVGYSGVGLAQYVSEEDPPFVCPTDYFASGIFCNGKYCDKVALDCGRRNGVTWGRSISFMPYFSEERGGRQDCPDGHGIAGFACKGKYCDNISLLCVAVATRSLSTVDCIESKSVSEEENKAGFLSTYIGTAMTCKGKYCDNKTLIGCLVK